jgi:hypothetical protein
MATKKNLLVLGLAISCSSLFTLIISQSVSSGVEFGCSASPKIGDVCTKRVTIRLRKVQSTGRDEFDRRFEPGAGWAIKDCDTRSGERGRTGEVSPPSCIEVQAGSTTTSSSYVQSEANRVFESIMKQRAQGGNESIQAYAELENKSRSEFSDLEKSASVHQSRNHGLQIKAWVAVEGGCRNRTPAFLGGDCINWGPGGSLDTDVIVTLVYVGTNQDIDRVAQKYIAELNEIKERERESKLFQERLAQESSCVLVDSRKKWQRITTKVGDGQFSAHDNKWSTNGGNLNAETNFKGSDMNGNRFSNNHKYGALLMRLPSGNMVHFDSNGWVSAEDTKEMRAPAGTTFHFRINEANEFLSDNQGSIEVCHGGGVG